MEIPKEQMLAEVATALAERLNCSIGDIPNGRYEFGKDNCPLYWAIRKEHNPTYPIIPVVVYNDAKWNVGSVYQNDVLAVGWWEEFSIDSIKSQWVKRIKMSQTG